MTGCIGVVTVLFNSDDVLPDFFESLARQEEVKYRLYVIDNSKTDSGCRLSRQLSERYGIDSKIIFNNFNGGIARGNNQGIELAINDDCTHILLANNDTFFEDEKILKKMLAILEKGLADLITPKIKYFGTNRIWCAGGRMLDWRGTTRHIGDGEIDAGQFNKPKYITYAPTCFMMFRKNILKSKNPMDEKYFVYYDDTDFIWSSRISGLKLYYMPEGELFHKVSYSTGGDDSDFSVYYMSRNRAYFILKNLPLFKKIFALIFLLVTRPLHYRGRFNQVMIATRDGFKLYFSKT